MLALSLHQFLVGLARREKVFAQECVPVGEKRVVAVSLHESEMGVIGSGLLCAGLSARVVDLLRDVDLLDEFREVRSGLPSVSVVFKSWRRGEEGAKD